MSIFTKLSVNGEVREVAALYDGSGNDIAATYETIANVSAKEQALSESVTSVNEDLTALTTRVAATEAFDTRINKNAEDIATSSAAITALQGVDAGYRTELDALTIKVGEATTSATNANNSLGNLSISIMTNSNKIATLEALVNDEAQGIDALNTQVDKNTADIAKAVEDLGKAQADLNKKVTTDVFTPVSTKVSELDTAVSTLQGAVANKAETSAITALQEQINSLLERVAALETPSDNPEEDPEVEPTDPEVTPEEDPINPEGEPEEEA